MESDKENYEVLDYPDGYLPLIYEPSIKDFLLFQDSLEILMNELDYSFELVYYNTKNEKSDQIKPIFVYYNEYDDSYLMLYVEILPTNLLKSKAYLLKLEKCLSFYNDTEEDVTALIKNILYYHPRKIDLLYLVGIVDDVDDSFSSGHSKKINSSFPYHYYLKPILKP